MKLKTLSRLLSPILLAACAVPSEDWIPEAKTVSVKEGLGTVLVGEATAPNGVDDAGAGTIEAWRYTAAKTGTANLMGFCVDSTNQAQQFVLGLYNSNTGGTLPTSLIFQTTLNSPVTGWNTFTIPNTTITSGKRYWLAMEGLGGNPAFCSVGGTSAFGSRDTWPATFTSFPATFPSAGNSFSGWDTGIYLANVAGSGGTGGAGGSSGSSGTGGTGGSSGSSAGSSGTSGSAGTAGAAGTSGASGSGGAAGSSGTAGSSGSSSGSSGTAGSSGSSGTGGSSGAAGSTSGTGGTSGASGTSGAAGQSGAGSSGDSGTGGASGTAGSSGGSGAAGTGTAGASGTGGSSGSSGTAGSGGSSGAGAGGMSGGGAGGTAGSGGSAGTLNLIFSDTFDACTPTPWHIGTRPTEGGLAFFVNTAIGDDGAGHGLITTRADSTTFPGYSFTTGVLQLPFSFKYGVVEVVAKLPDGTGSWPAIWLLGDTCRKPHLFHIDDGEDPNCNWPAIGGEEIDIAERNRNGLTDAQGNINEQIHYTGTANKTDPQLPDFPFYATVADNATAFHTYRFEWSAQTLVWKIDGAVTRTVTDPVYIPNSPMFLLIQNEMGGVFGGVPNPATYPDTFAIDSVKIWQ